MGTPSERAADPALYAAGLLAEAREELNRADQKAAMLLAATSVAIGAVIAGFIASGWSPTSLGPPWTAVWWLGSGLAFAGTIALAISIYPRIGTSKGAGAQRLFYFGNASEFEDTSAIKRALGEAAADPLERTADQLLHVSQIVRRKYRSIQVAMWCLAVGVGLCMMAVIRP